MKCFLAICLIAAVFGFAYADDSCIISGKKLKVGETYAPLGECMEYKCQPKNTFSAKTCPSIETLEPCKEIPEDYTKPYPQCCPQHEC